jgi:predicted dehydrogenase
MSSSTAKPSGSDHQAQAATSTTSTGAASTPSTRRLRVGVIGLGIGRMHIEGWRQHPQVDVVAVADSDPARLNAVGEQFAIDARHTSAAAMLANEPLDVVSICTPNRLHKALTLDTFAAGCHVLCEKPMAMNAVEGREMLDAAEAAGKRLMINFSYRFSAPSRALKAQVETGQFGEFYFGRTVWHRRRGMPGFGGWFGIKSESGGGPLIDLGVHRLDLALWLMGYPKPTWVLGSCHDPIARAAAQASGQAFDVEDLAAAFIRFDNGASLVLEASWAAHIQEAELMETRLLGSKAGLVQKNLHEGYTFDAHLFSDGPGGAQLDTHIHTPPTPAKSAMFEYADAILQGRPHPAPGEQGLIVMQLLDAIYESARSGAPVSLAGR